MDNGGKIIIIIIGTKKKISLIVSSSQIEHVNNVAMFRKKIIILTK